MNRAAALANQTMGGNPVITAADRGLINAIGACKSNAAESICNPGLVPINSRFRSSAPREGDSAKFLELSE